jgi:iron complex transport system substrate-binding protein
VLLLTASCGERAEPLGELAQPYPVTVRGADEQSVVVDSQPRRIVAFDAGAAELVEALGVGERLVGAPAGSIPGVTEVVRPTGQLLVDAAVQLEPDLVVATPGTDRVDVGNAVRRSEAALYLEPSATIEDVERAALELGYVVGKPVTARGIRAAIMDKTAEVDAIVGEREPVTVFVDSGFFIPVSDRTLLGSLVERARGDNVAGEEAGLGPLDVEELARLDPDVYIALSDSGTTLEDLRADPRTRELSAVRNGRFVELDSALVTRAGPRIAEAYEAVAAALHPDAFG